MWWLLVRVKNPIAKLGISIALTLIAIALLWIFLRDKFFTGAVAPAMSSRDYYDVFACVLALPLLIWDTVKNWKELQAQRKGSR